MKKQMIMMAMLCAFGAAAFGQTFEEIRSEGWLDFGFEYGRGFDYLTNSDGQSESDKTTNFSGAVNVYVFKNKNALGFFEHLSLGLPYKLSESYGGETKTYGRNDLKDSAVLNFAFGPVWRVYPTKHIALFGGLGLNMTIYGTDFTYKVPYPQILDTYTTVIGSGSTLDLGIAANLGIKLDVTKRSYITLGATGAFNFLQLSSVTAKGYTPVGTTIKVSDKNAVTKNYKGFEVRPYIGIGVYTWGISKSGYGRLPENQ